MKNIHLACVHQPQIYNKQCCCCCCCVCMHHTGWEYRIHQHAKREIEPQPITRTSIYWYQFISAILAKIYSRSPKRASAAKFRAKEKNTTTNTIQSAHSEKEECERENKMNKERTWTQGRREKKKREAEHIMKIDICANDDCRFLVASSVVYHSFIEIMRGTNDTRADDKRTAY